MLMPVSSEFIDLCRAQIVLLTQAFEASISVVYLTNELVEGAQTRLVPIAAYPESLVDSDWRSSLALPPVLLPSQPPLQELAESEEGTEKLSAQAISPAASQVNPSAATPMGKKAEPFLEAGALVDQRQCVLPLIHEEVVFGLLVTRRDDRAWNEWEQGQFQEIAKTLAIACVLDQRYQWMRQERQQIRLLQAQQHDLMDNLLHQFRNSLTALQTFGKLILRKLLPSDRSHELATSITQEAARLRELAQQMEQALKTGTTPPTLPLALPHAAASDATLNEQLGDATLDTLSLPHLPTVGLLAGAELTLERCLVEVILAPLLISFRALAQEQGLQLEMHFPEDLPPVWANPQALREVFNNLLENAIKYTTPPGYIWVTASEDASGSAVEITVTDTGAGIPPEDLAQIFERHYRGVQAKGQIAGSGLGLAIARSLVEQMHGKIQVFSPARTNSLPSTYVSSPENGPGTTFSVQLATALEKTETAP